MDVVLESAAPPIANGDDDRASTEMIKIKRCLPVLSKPLALCGHSASFMSFIVRCLSSWVVARRCLPSLSVGLSCGFDCSPIVGCWH